MDGLVRPVDEMRRFAWTTIVAVVAALALCALPARACANATLKLADLRKGVTLSQPQISPDGTRVVLLVSRRDYEKDRTVSDLVIVDVRTKAARALVRDSQIRAARWAPNGGVIAYIATPKSGDDKSPQLFVLQMDGGEPQQLTHEKQGVNDFAWRPDSRALAYVATPEAPNAKAIEGHDDAFVVTDEAWTAQAAPIPDRLYEIGAGGGTAHRIVSWQWSVAGGLTYSADGRSLFVTRVKPTAHPNRYLASEIVRVSVMSGEVSRIPTLSQTQGDPLRSMDGRFIAYDFANPHGTMQAEAAVSDSAGTHPRWVTARLDRNVSIEGFTPDNGLAVSADDGTTSRLFHVAEDGAATPFPIGSIDVFSASVARDGTIAFTGAASDHPTELYVLRPRMNAPQRLTHYNDWIGAFSLGRPRTIVWRSTNGFHPDGVLIAPPRWSPGSARAPLVLYIHGGPTAASTIGFSGFAQVLAAHGWFVFEPNYRGSDNLGLTFARTTVPHIASVPGEDIEDGLAAVLKLGVVDPSRIGVSGWSEGGLMTSWLIGHDARWKAAVSGAAVNDWIGYSAMTDAKDFTPQFIGSSPWTDTALMSTFSAESPLTYASNVKTPTLILSDAGDFRVPTPLSYEFYHDVRATGTPVQFVIFPVNGHFPSDPVRVEDVFRRWEAWLAKYL
jgi:dipeptidyl aminopeptidase/acylaminoacyl peptidase